MYCPYSHWSMVKLPVSIPLKENESFPNLHPCQKLSLVESYTLASLSQILRVLFGGFLSKLLFLGDGDCHRSLLCLLPQLWVCAIDTVVKVASLPVIVSGSIDHGPTLDSLYWRQQRPWSSTWSPASEHAMDLQWQYIHHGHQHSPLLQWKHDSRHGPHGSTDQDINLASGGSIGHWHQYGPLAEVKPLDINMPSGCSTDYGHLDICMIFCGSTGCRYQHRTLVAVRTWTLT